MPPVRWKTLATATVFVICLTHIHATREAKELIEDGWKPIIGHGGLRESHFSKENIHYRPDEVHRDNFPKDNHQHRQQIKKPDEDHQIHNQKTTEKNQTPKKQMTSSAPHGVPHHTGQYHKNKMPHNTKHHQVHYITSQGFTQPKPVLTHRSQNKIPKYPVMGKTHVAPSMSGKRVAKPPRGPVGAYSQREEILAPAPSTGLGNFAYYTHNNPSRLQHQNLDYVNNFAQQNDLFQFQRLPVQQYVIPKQPQNEIPYTFQAQNDEYTRNLVPPPPSKEYIEKEKQKTKQIPKKEPTTEIPKVTKPQNDILVQLQSPYHQQNPYYILQNQNEQAIDVQVTKENVKELQHNIPIHFPNQENYYQFQKPSQPPSRPTYEVTESKDWQDTPSYEQFQFQHAVKNEKRRPQKQEIFLPTPVKPINPIPTLPTQNEASTVFTELSQKINKQKQQLDPTFFSIKEVSTHYPIIGRPIPNHFEFSLTNDDQENEITTLRPKVNKYVVEDVATEPPMTTTPLPVTKNWEQKRRPNPSRRRRPYRTKPTTEEVIEEEIETTTISRPQRRRPIHQRTTEASIVENKRSRYRTRPRPTQETVVVEMIEDPKPTLEYAQKTRVSTYKQTPERIRISNEEKYPKREEVESTEEQPSSEEEMMDAIENMEYNTQKYDITNEPTTETSSEETEEYSTKTTPEITIKEVWETQTEREETTLATTTTTTSTTPEPTTTRSKLRTRKPVQYQARPKFSVKEYKQRINEYIASTTESTKITEQTARTRPSYRTRRPIISKPEEPKEETTEIFRKKFIPKDPRHGAASETREEEVKPSRRPGRYRSTTPSTTTTTQKVAIKPNIFNNLRRPPHASLRERILSKNKTVPIEKTTEQPREEEEVESIENEESEPTETIFEHVISSTEAPKIVVSTTRTTTTTEIDDEIREVDDDVREGDEEDREVDILKMDAVLQSQRVSDLTSSAQNDYNTPGIFKSVNSNVRRVPSYFTIATEDPILPIEAFFTNINKERN